MVRDEDKIIVYSAYPLKSEEYELIRTKFNFIANNNFENIVDRSLLAGVIILYQNKLIDLSLKGKLSSLEKKLYEING